MKRKRPKQPKRYLTPELKIYYQEQFALYAGLEEHGEELIAGGHYGWLRDHRLDGILGAINANPNLQTMLSRMPHWFENDQNLTSYIQLTYTAEVEGMVEQMYRKWKAEYGDMCWQHVYRPATRAHKKERRAFDEVAREIFPAYAHRIDSMVNTEKYIDVECRILFFAPPSCEVNNYGLDPCFFKKDIIEPYRSFWDAAIADLVSFGRKTQQNQDGKTTIHNV
jgi:hypothetical protein